MPLSLSRRLPAGCLLLFCLAGCVSWCEKHYPDGASQAENGPLHRQAAAPDRSCLKPSEAVMCLTVRPRAQLGLKRDGSDTPLLERWGDRVGIPLKNVDHFAVLVLDPEADRRALVVRTTRPIEPGRVLLVCGAGETVREGGRTLYTARHGLTVAFPEPTLAVLADSPATMKACLEDIDHLPRELKEEAQYDLTLSVQAQPVPKIDGRSGERWGKCPPKVSLAGMPLPVDVKYATVCVSVGDAVDVSAKVACADADSARKLGQLASSFLDMARGQILAMSGQFGTLTSLGEEGNEEAKKVRDLVPFDLVKPVERALGAASVRVHGKAVGIHVRLPVSGARAGKELKKCWPLLGEKSPDGPGLIFDAPPKPAACQAVPAAAPVQPCAAQPPVVCQPLPPIGPASAPVPLAPMAPMPIPPQMGGPVVPPGQTIPAPICPVTSIPLTVANCRKEPVLLFRVRPDGQRVFERKVEAGDAVDVRTGPAESWEAVFMTAPYRAGPVAGTVPVWLLRTEQ
jgi:hypothetical protein